MPLATVQCQAPAYQDGLGISLEGLREALSADSSRGEREWAEAIGKALRRAERALRQHRAAARAPDGLLAEVDETRPTLARQANLLRADHDVFLVQIVNLRDGVRRIVNTDLPNASAGSTNSSVAEVWECKAIRQGVEQLLTRLQENKEAETKLVFDSINTDIGAGD